MSKAVDIQKVFKKSVSQVSVDALSKKGFKQVKVLNQATVMRLISEAVDQVLSSRSKEISSEEREKVIKESQTQFETLAKQRLEKERSKIDELQAQNRSLAGELETQKNRAANSMEIQAERDQAKARLATLESDLDTERKKIEDLQKQLSEKNAEAVEFKAQLGAKTDEVTRLEGQAKERSDEFQQITANVRKSEGERDSLRDELLTGQKRIAELEGLLAAKDQELGQAKTDQSSASEAMMEKLLLAISDQVQNNAAQSSGVDELKGVLEGLSDKLSNIGSGGGSFKGGAPDFKDNASLEAYFEKATEDDKLESNLSKVKVRQAKAGAVKGALAKLREMQQGGEDGEQ